MGRRRKKLDAQAVVDEIVLGMYEACFAGLDRLADSNVREAVRAAVLRRMAANMSRDLDGDAPAQMYA